MTTSYTRRELATAQWLVESSEIERHDFAFVGSPRCDVCGRVVAAADCDADPEMCWHALIGRDRHCDLLRTPGEAP